MPACMPWQSRPRRRTNEEGHLTPVFFGSALRNSGVRDLTPVFLAVAAFALKYEQDKWPEIVFSDIKDN